MNTSTTNLNNLEFIGFNSKSRPFWQSGYFVIIFVCLTKIECNLNSSDFVFQFSFPIVRLLVSPDAALQKRTIGQLVNKPLFYFRTSNSDLTEVFYHTKVPIFGASLLFSCLNEHFIATERRLRVPSSEATLKRPAQKPSLKGQMP